MLKHVSKLLPRELSVMAYQALIRSRLEFCSSVFVGVADTHARKLETIQKIAARIICDKPHDFHSKPLLEELKLDSLKRRRNQHAIDLATSILSRQTHPALFGILDNNSENKRTKIGQKRFSVIAEQLLNNHINSWANHPN